DEEDVITINEGFMVDVFKNILDMDMKAPFKRIPYDEAMNRYGSDKPDTRFGLELTDLSDILAMTTFKVFAGAINQGGSVRAICIKGGAESLSRKELDKLVDFVKTYKAKGLAFTRITADATTSSYEKFLSEEEITAIRERLDVNVGDVILIVGDCKNEVVFDSLGALRCHLATRFQLIEKGTFDLLWVTDFPLFEYDQDNNRYVAKHHPFTAPKEEDIATLLTNPADAKARAYDLVLNGCEIGGGSIRINNADLQQRMFEALGFTQELAYERFGFLLDAFAYGVPPHGGMAYGLDRLVMLLLGKESIKEVIAFPKVQNASELMTMCPSQVEDKNLDELHIMVKTQ
ncbi:MAG: aspartate--tRNA ligase, partial [Oscillospiraceae bacterium]